MILSRTPVFYYSKQKGSVQTSTYSVEFMGMSDSVEEVVALRYMLGCLGVNVDTASAVYGDSLSVIQKATIKDSLFKEMHIAI